MLPMTYTCHTRRRTFALALFLAAASGCAVHETTAIGSSEPPGAPPRTTPIRPTQPPVRGTEPVQTDSVAYTATLLGGEGSYRTYAVRVVARYTNRTPGPVYLARCYPSSPTPIYGLGLVGDTTGGGTWGSAFNPAWGCVGHENPIEVAAGSTRTDTLILRAPNAWDGVTKGPFGRLDGRLRLAYGVQTCRPEAQCRLPADSGVSNAFDVLVPR
jgi:hypothetical protein